LLEAPPAPGALNGTETILVVDDEPALRAVCARGLQQYGYTVLEADSMQDALRFAERFSGPIHAVVTDLVMPGGRGTALVESLVTLRPGLKALYMSGYVDEALLATIDPVCYVEKPFTPETLARRVRQVLSG